MTESLPILTSAEMRAAEQRTIDAGTSVEILMERAGAAAAEAAWRYGEPLRTLILCGPGNNGGDGYVVARILRDRGVEVEVASFGEPSTPAAIAARDRWNGPVVPLQNAGPAPLLVDALFGTGLGRGLERAAVQKLMALTASASSSIAIDLPSGISSDDGSILSAVPIFDLTVALGALKPAHLLQPSARHMGRLVIADIGVEAGSRLHLVGRPLLHPPGPDDHKYSRGFVAVVGGEMPGAAALSACAAARAGAGYVRLLSETYHPGLFHAIVQGPGDPATILRDSRIGATVFGPGLGRSESARRRVEHALTLDSPLILDADALWAIDRPHPLGETKHLAIVTPHEGEFSRLFGVLDGSKIERARQAAEISGAVVLLKGSDTVIAAPDGRAAIAPPAPSWLASAGTGDVLTGIIAAMRARGMEAFDAACAGAWLHGRAAEHAGPALIADDLLGAVRAAVVECL